MGCSILFSAASREAAGLTSRHDTCVKAICGDIGRPGEAERITEQAVSDLRQAIAADPQIRFQAINDPDFEQIREEPAFIDIIEPTPTGD